MLEFINEDPIVLINKEKVVRSKPVKGVKAFYISKYDPRMPQPMHLLSKNYHHMKDHPVLENLFPRENLVGGTRRLKNLSEILSPTFQPSSDDGQGGQGPGDDGAGAGGGDGRPRGQRWNGSYHCQQFKSKGKCDTCSHMVETSAVTSFYFNRRFAIHGHNVHLPASQKDKHRWFVYLCEDLACTLQYVGSTTDVCARWASTKKSMHEQEYK